MKTSTCFTLAAALTAAVCTSACGDVGDESADEDGAAEEIGEAESAITMSPTTCTVEKSGKVYRAEAQIRDGRLSVLLDGEPGRNKNNVAVSARYDRAVLKEISVPDDRRSNQWIDIPVFLEKGAHIEIGVDFDLAGFDRECKLDIRL
jgi:hypothetical protein